MRVNFEKVSLVLLLVLLSTLVSAQWFETTIYEPDSLCGVTHPQTFTYNETDNMLYVGGEHGGCVIAIDGTTDECNALLLKTDLMGNEEWHWNYSDSLRWIARSVDITSNGGIPSLETIHGRTYFRGLTRFFLSRQIRRVPLKTGTIGIGILPILMNATQFSRLMMGDIFSLEKKDGMITQPTEILISILLRQIR